jgi:hypothetical protein
MRRPRFSLRLAMALVAVVASGLGSYVGIESRRLTLLGLAEAHRSQMIAWEEVGPSEASRKRFDLAGREVSLKAHRWHEVLAKKYERAARYPWLPVEPDPPEPR